MNILFYCQISCVLFCMFQGISLLGQNYVDSLREEVGLANEFGFRPSWEDNYEEMSIQGKRHNEVLVKKLNENILSPIDSPIVNMNFLSSLCLYGTLSSAVEFPIDIGGTPLTKVSQHLFSFRFYPNCVVEGGWEKPNYFIDTAGSGKYILLNIYDLTKGDLDPGLLEDYLLRHLAWEPYGRYWELKAKDFEALKKMNELKISAFEKLLKKTENDPQFAKLYLENRPDSYNPERRIIKRKPEALEKAWQKFSARWEKENPKLVPKFKIIPLLPSPIPK